MLSCVALSHGAPRSDGEPGRGREKTAPVPTLARRPSRSFPKPATREAEPVETSSFVSSVVEAASAFEETSSLLEKPSIPEATDEKLRTAIGSGAWSRAIEIAHQLFSMHGDIDSTLLDQLFHGLCQRGKFRQAIQLYDRIPEEDISLQYTTFHLMIQSALKGGAYTFALKLYKDMKLCGYSLNQMTYCLILTGLHRDRRKGSRSHSAAYEIWDEVKNSNCTIDAALFRAGCGACVAVGRMEEAESLIPIMRQAGYRADGRFYNILTKGYCRLRDMKSAFKCFEEMKAAGILPTRTTYNTLLQGFILSNEMEHAEHMMKYSVRYTPLRSPLVEKAVCSQGCQPDVWTFTSLMKGYLKQGQFDKVIELFEEFQSQGGKPNEVTFGVLIDAYGQQGRLDRAYAQLDVMMQAGLKPNTVIYNTLIKGYASRGTKQQILSLLAEMKQSGVPPAVDTLNTLLSKMLDLQGNASTVSALFDEMTKLGFLPDAVSYTFLLRAAHREGNVQRCREIFETMESSPALEVDGACWSLMVSVLAKSGDMSGAEEMLQGAVEYAQDHTLPVPLKGFGAIIQGYSSERDLPAAIAKFRWFCKLGGRPDGAMLEQLLEVCIVKHDMHHALKILRATELLDKQTDLTKYRRMLKRMEQDTEAWNPVRNEQKSIGFERLKFWIGMPNSYYSSDWP